MLRKIRIVLALVFFTGLTLLFLDFSGSLHTWLGWMAKIQFLPAVLALNFVTVAALVLLTLVFGRVYCSVICPLGVMQDFFGWLGKKSKKNRYHSSPAKNWLRYSILAIFILAIILGIGSLVALLAPYSAFGRIAQNLLAPLWQWGNNLLAYFSERAGNYAFYTTDVWIKSLPTFIVAAVTLVVLAVLAWRNGRTYCNTICPVGSVLGFLSRFSLLKPRIDTSKCNSCGLCERNCKAACIQSKSHTIDYSRCVACMDCISTCRQKAVRYGWRGKKTSVASDTCVQPEADGEAMSRRAFLAVGATLAAGLAKAENDAFDGGLAVVEDKKIPERKTPIVPPGALSIRHLANHCTGCQLCVSECPNQVLRPSTDLKHLMQPESSYERGYCRPECTRCSEVCPTGAIQPISREEKTSIQIGHAVWIADNCIPLVNGDACGNCARHCPSGAITMVPSDPGNRFSPKVPAINEERCIGCGACENLCPARPFSAIYVEGHEQHRSI